MMYNGWFDVGVPRAGRFSPIVVRTVEAGITFNHYICKVATIYE